MADTKIRTTQEGYDEKVAELDERIQVIRKEIAQKLKEARAQGDLSENAEYDAAKKEQAENEGRIEELENFIKNAEIVTNIDESKVSMGLYVTVKDNKFKEEMEFHIVGASEAKSLKNNISEDSPLGSALIGHKVGDNVTVEAPMGTIKYKIIKIEKVRQEETEKDNKKKK